MSRFTTFQESAISSKVVDLYKNEDRLMALLGSRVEQQAGETFQKTFRSLDKNLKSAGRYEAHVAAESGDYVRASYTMGKVYMDDQISGLEKEFQGTPDKISSGTHLKIESELLEDMRNQFKHRFKERLWNGDGLALNGGGGVSFVGLTQFIVQSPATGTYAGINRATYSNWQNYQISGAAGPSTSWVQDCWERVLTAQMGATDESGSHGKGSVLIGTVANVIQIQNKAFSQNTSLGSAVNKIVSVNGLELVSDDNVASGLVYIIDPRYIGVAVPPARSTKNMGIKFYSKSKLPDQVDPMDEVFVMDFVGTPLCWFPKAQAIITSAS